MNETRMINATSFWYEGDIVSLTAAIRDWIQKNRPMVDNIVFDNTLPEPQAIVYWYPSRETQPLVFPLAQRTTRYWRLMPEESDNEIESTPGA